MACLAQAVSSVPSSGLSTESHSQHTNRNIVFAGPEVKSKRAYAICSYMPKGDIVIQAALIGFWRFSLRFLFPFPSLINTPFSHIPLTYNDLTPETIGFPWNPYNPSNSQNQLINSDDSSPNRQCNYQLRRRREAPGYINNQPKAELFSRLFTTAIIH